MRIVYKLVAIGILCLATNGYASTVILFNDASSVTIGTPSYSFVPSHNVTVRYLPSTTTVPSGAGVIAFTLSSFHVSGTKQFATSSANRKIFSKDATSDSNPPPAPNADETADFTGYTEL